MKKFFPIFFTIWFLWISPNIFSFFRLKKQLNLYQNQIESIQKTLTHLHFEILALETHRPTQLREIRKVLGYVTPYELIFDFQSRLETHSH